MRYKISKANILMFDKIFLKVHSSITIAYKDFKFCLLSPCIYFEGTVSQIFILDLSSYFMSKNGKHFLQNLSIIFEVS